MHKAQARVAGEIATALMTASGLFVTALDIIPVGWLWLAFATFWLFVGLIYWHLLDYRHQIDERNKLRKVADCLAQKLAYADALRPSHPRQDVIESWVAGVHEYLLQSVGRRWAEPFRVEVRRPQNADDHLNQKVASLKEIIGDLVRESG
jgi:hypothetical protein